MNVFQTGRKRYLQSSTSAYREWAGMSFVLHMTLPSISYISHRGHFFIITSTIWYSRYLCASTEVWFLNAGFWNSQRFIFYNAALVPFCKECSLLHFFCVPLYLLSITVNAFFSSVHIFALPFVLLCCRSGAEQSRAGQRLSWSPIPPLTCHPLPCPLVSPLVSRREREMTSAIDASARADGAATKMVVTW